MTKKKTLREINAKAVGRGKPQKVPENVHTMAIPPCGDPACACSVKRKPRYPSMRAEASLQAASDRREGLLEDMFMAEMDPAYILYEGATARDILRLGHKHLKSEVNKLKKKTSLRILSYKIRAKRKLEELKSWLSRCVP